MTESELKVVDKKEDVIEIPLGKWASSVKKNPWILVTLVLAVVLIGSLVSDGGIGGIGANAAGQNVIEFINAQEQGSATLISAEREGDLYNIVLNYQGQEVPVYTTLDGEFLVSSLIPISSTAAPSNTPASNSGGNVNQLSEDNDPFIGDINAPITIIEFSDYQCPFCQRFWSETLPLLKEEYIDTGKAKLVYRDYPIPSHSQAQISAEAAECVRAQSDDATYFEYHDVLFANQGQLGRDNLIAWADDLGYDIESCLDNGDFAGEVNADFIAGGQLGTPTFFINGVKIEGAQPFVNFKSVIDTQLADLGLA